MHAATLRTRYALPSSPRLSLVAMAAIVAAHAGVIILLLSFNVVSIPPQLTTLMVHIVSPSAPTVSVAPAQPKASDSKPVARAQPMPRKPPAERARLAAPADAQNAVASAPAPVDAPPLPAPASNVATSPAPATAGGNSDSAATTSQPRLDADYLLNPAPAYPPLSRRLGEQGRVVLRVLVDRNGRAQQVDVKSSSGSTRLDQAAQDAVGRWKFVPAKRGDEAVDAWVLVPIVFNLRS